MSLKFSEIHIQRKGAKKPCLSLYITLPCHETYKINLRGHQNVAIFTAVRLGRQAFINKRKRNKKKTGLDAASTFKPQLDNKMYENCQCLKSEMMNFGKPKSLVLITHVLCTPINPKYSQAPRKSEGYPGKVLLLSWKDVTNH